MASSAGRATERLANFKKSMNQTQIVCQTKSKLNALGKKHEPFSLSCNRNGHR